MTSPEGGFLSSFFRYADLGHPLVPTGVQLLRFPQRRPCPSTRPLLRASGRAEGSRGGPVERLEALARSRGPLRRALTLLAVRLVETRGWERLGFARLRDYGVERLGLSARSLQDLAHVGRILSGLPAVSEALETGALTWTKVRLLCRVARPEDEVRWVSLARQLSARALAREVRSLDLQALGANPARAGPLPTDEDGSIEEPREAVRIPCAPSARGRWSHARRLAQRVAGEALPVWESMEAVAAEVASALPLEPSLAREVSELPWDAVRREPDVAADRDQPARSVPSSPSTRAAANGCAAQADRARPAASPFLSGLLAGLDSIDALELDARLRRAVALEQGLEARIAPLLLRVARDRLHHEAGYRSLDELARERLGLSPRRARMLLRLARAGEGMPLLARAWREGRLSWVKAHALVPVLALSKRFAGEWIARAERVTARRLEEDVDAALVLADEDPVAFEASGGVPGRLPEGRQAGAHSSGSEGEASPGPEAETRQLYWLAPRPAARFLRAVLCSVRRRVERETGRLPTPGEAFVAMLDHAIATWSLREGRLPASHRVHERDGWRCALPGCTSYRNLHDHHVVFRSRCGSNALDNRVTLCAWHHLRGVHGGLVRVNGRAPDGLVHSLPVGSYSAGEVALTVSRSG